MIIVAQHTEALINFNNVEDIWIDNPLNSTSNKFTIQAETLSDSITLGQYDTEERCKEIFREILVFYNKNGNSYYMPEE